MVKTREQLIDVFLEFFKSHGHKIIPNASLIPEHDPTVLFTTAGMHPLVPFILGQKHPSGKRLANVQKCIRTADIEGVGDDVHLTFFEMLGNWSLGDYWKDEAIRMSYEFLTKILKIDENKLAISCFRGEKNINVDDESAVIWEQFGINKERIAFLGKEDNWWGPAGKTGPCGPDTEMFFWNSEKPIPKKFNIKDKEWVEIWNDVFMQYNKDEHEKYSELKQKNVDTGMGVERTLAVLNKLNDIYMTEAFLPIIEKIHEISNKDYSVCKKEMRIIADHIKAAVFILAEQVQPSNIERGYVLRRLIRRAIRYGKLIGINKNFTEQIAEEVINIYKKSYPELEKHKKFIFQELEKEENKFLETLEKGIKKFNEIKKLSRHEISGIDSFLLFQSFGFPIEMTKELAQENKLMVNEKEFQKEMEKHQELSRQATEKKFKSGLADTSEATTRLHTATHLLHAALRQVLGKTVQQKGSNITPERLRFDFSFDRKMTEEEIKKVEHIVNKKIQEKLPVKREEMSLEEARKTALAFFTDRYGEQVSVYSIGKKGEEFSKEVCAGPHISNTSELGKFKILKEEGIAAGVRRIKAVLE